MGRTYEKVGNKLKVVETNTVENTLTIKQLRAELQNLRAARAEYNSRIDARIDDFQSVLEQAIAIGVEEEKA